MKTLQKTVSVCPICLARIPATYVAEDDIVYMDKTCEEHGNFRTLVWEGEESFLAWTHTLIPNKTPMPQTEVKHGCPYDCGICPNHKQLTCCVLMEVTQACNLHCPVCFAKSETDRNGDPSLHTIADWYDMLMAQGGPFNIQLSGGEPTLRDDLPEIIKIGKEKGFTFFQLNTNGIRIAKDIEYLKALKKSGLSTVFLQFDGFEENTHKELRGNFILEEKKRAIEHCKELNIGVVLVPVLKKGLNEHEIGEIIRFAFESMPTVRGVHFQPLSFFGRHDETLETAKHLTLPALLREIESQTNGLMAVSDFSPGGAEHARCSFHGDFFREETGEIRALRSRSASASACCSSAQAREVVSHKWTAPEISKQQCECTSESTKLDSYDTSSLDDFLRLRQENTLSISAMGFQDASNLDLERLQYCYIHIISPEGTLIPFCSYNLTAANGTGLYRKAEKN